MRKKLREIEIENLTLNKIIPFFRSSGDLVKYKGKLFLYWAYDEKTTINDVYWDLKKDTVGQQKKGTQKIIKKLFGLK